MNTDKSRNSRLSLNIFYFATGDDQKDSGLEIEFMIDTGASCSIINYRTFWEICQLQHPITIQKSTKVTKTYSGQTVPMIGYATITFSYDPDGQFIFPLTVWITEMRTQNLLGMDFCQKQVSGIHFDLPGIEIKNPPKSICFGSFQQNKSYPHLSQILTIRTPYTMYIDAKSARCWKYSPTDTHIHFPPGSTFQPNRTAVATGLSFINTLCTRSECNLPILMENNKNHQITLPKGRIGFSSLDVVDRDEPKYQIRSPYELTNAIISTDERYNDCFLLHSTVPAQNSDDSLQIIYGTEDSILQQPNSIGHCISADARMSKGFADFLSHRIPGLRSTCRKAKLFMGQVFPFWDSTGNRYIYNLVTKERYCDKPNLSTLSTTLEAMKIHASTNGVSTIAIPKHGCGLDQMNWQEVVKLLRDIFAYADVQIAVYTLEENGVHALSAEGDADFYADDEIERYSEEFLLEDRELETDFTKDSKSCQPTCDEQFPVLREKDHNNRLIDHYLQYQPKELINYVKEFNFQYSDITDEEMVLLIDMLVDARDVYSQHKFDVGKTRQNFHVTLKPHVELKRQRPSKVPLHLKEKLEKLLTQLKDADIIREMGDDDEMGSLFVNPIILMPKNDYVKLVIDARYLNSVTDLTNYSWPLEPVQMIMTRVNGKVFSVSDLSCAYHQVPLSNETQKLTSFIIGGKQYTYTRGFYGLCGLPNFFSRLMTIHFDPLIKKKQAITYIDDTIMQSQNKNEMFTVINEYHTLLRKAGLKAAPDKTFFFLKKVKFLGHVISPDGIQPIAKRVKDLKNLKSPESKRDVMKVLGCLGFYSCYIKNLHVDSQPFYDLIKDSTPFHWTHEHEKLFQTIKDRISEDTILAVPSTDYPFHIHVDSSNVGTGCILIQQFPEGKRIISFNSRIFDKAEQKMSTLHRELCGIVSALQTYEHYIIGSPFPIYLYCDHKPILYLWGRKGQLSHRFFRYQVIITKFQNLKIIWTPGSNLAFPDILSRNVTVEEYQKHQLQHKKIPRDIEFYDEHGSPVTYRIQHDDNPNDTCNDFYPIHCQQGNDNKVLRLHNDGENFTLNSLSNEFPTTTIQSATDCFRLGRTINQFRRLCLPSAQSLNSVEDSEPTYSSINSLNTSEDDYALEETYDNESDAAAEDDEDNLVCEVNTHADHYRLCKAKAAHDAVLGKVDAPLAKKPLTVNEAPHLDTKSLIAKLDEVAKTVDLDISTILAEQIKDPVLGTVRSWIRKGISPEPKTPEIQQSKGLLRYCQEFDRLLIEEEGQFLCYNEPTDKLDDENLRICLPLSLFLACFRLGHYNEMGGHMGAAKTYNNAKRFYYWPGMFDWICALTADCLTCQNNKPKPKHKNEVPLEEWQNETIPFRTIHIDHKGPLQPPSNRNLHCLLVIDAFSRFLMVYPVTNTGAQATISAVEKWIHSFGIPQSIVHDRGTAFINTEFINWTKELGITLRPRTAHSPWTNGKIETQNQHIARYWRNFLNDAGNNWSSLAPNFAFAHNTSVNYTTGKTPYEIVFGTKPQIPMSLKLGLYRNKHKLCCSDFCKDLPPHSHSENNLKNQLLDNILRPQLSHALLERERDFKRIYSTTFERCREQTARSHAYRNRFKLGQHLEVGQKVLYENHRQDLSKSQKLQQRRLGPFTVTKRVTNTTYQIQDDKDPTILKTVHRNHLVEYYPKEETLPPMIEEYVPMDRRHDDFYERFMEQRFQKINNPGQLSIEDSLPFPIEPLRPAPVTLPQKRVSNTSSDSGVHSPQVLSPAMPVTPEHSQSYPIPSTSRMTPSEPLTPIQQFINNSRNAKTKEPKYNRSQPDHLNSQSVLRTRTRQGYKL